MSSVFDIDQRGKDLLDEEAALNPLDVSQLTPETWTGTGSGIGQGIMRGGVKAADFLISAGSMLDARGNAPNERALKFNAGKTGEQLRDESIDLKERARKTGLDYWTPKADEVGAAGQLLGSLSEMAIPLMAGGGNPSLLLGSTSLDVGKTQIDQGVDARTATASALLNDVTLAVGFRIPFIGKTIPGRMASGVAGNVAIGYPSREGQQAILESAGYDELAKQYDYNTEAFTLDVLTGALFGGLSIIGMKKGAKPAPEVTPEQVDALLTAKNAKHFQQDTAPGTPADANASVSHQKAMGDAIEQLLKGEPVNVAASITDADFIRPVAPPKETPISRAIADAYPDLAPTTALDSLPLDQRQALRFNSPELNAFAAQVESRYDLPPGLINAIKNAGERSNSNQTSPAGARGVMQFMPENLKKYGVTDPTDPVQMIDAAGRYLKDTLKYYKGDIQAVIADYNGGPRQALRVVKGQQPAAAETRAYVERVKSELEKTGARTGVQSISTKHLSTSMSHLRIAEGNLAEGRGSVTPKDPVEVNYNIDTGEYSLQDGYHRYLDARGGTIEKALAQSKNGEFPDIKADVTFVQNIVRDGFTETVPVSSADLARLQPANLKTVVANGADNVATTERGMILPMRYAVTDVGSLVTSHLDDLKTNPAFPAELQPRDRGRAASEGQISRIENAINPELLGASPKAGDGAPIVGADQIVESGNARTIALRRAYGSDSKEIIKFIQDDSNIDPTARAYTISTVQAMDEAMAKVGRSKFEYLANIELARTQKNDWYANEATRIEMTARKIVDMTERFGLVANTKADGYRQWLIENAERFGLDPAEVAKLDRPALVRVGQGDYNRAEFARQANESSVAQMSVTELAASDAARTPDLLGLITNEDGSINPVQSAPFIKGFMTHVVSPSEHGMMMTADGQLSQQGLQRIRNAVFAKAYGDAEIVALMAESTDANVKNVLSGMLRAAPAVARIRDLIDSGARYPIDVTTGMIHAIRKFSQLKREGLKVKDMLDQQALFDDGLPPEVRNILIGLDENARAPKRVAEMIGRMVDEVDRLGDPRQASMLEDIPRPAAPELIMKAIESVRSDFEVKQTADLFSSPEIVAARQVMDANPDARIMLEDGREVSVREAMKSADDAQVLAQDDVKAIDAAITCYMRNA